MSVNEVVTHYYINDRVNRGRGLLFLWACCSSPVHIAIGQNMRHSCRLLPHLICLHSQSHHYRGVRGPNTPNCRTGTDQGGKIQAHLSHKQLDV